MGTKVKKSILLLVCYLLLLVWNAPAQLLQVVIPKDIKVGSFSGSLWQGSLHQLSWRSFMLEELNWQVTFFSWLPAIEVEFHDPQGLHGAGTLRGWHSFLRGWNSLQLYQWQISAPADWVRQQVPLSVPLTVQGTLQLRLQQGELTPQGCRGFNGGMLNWQHAQLATPLGDLDLADVQGQLSCNEQGALALVLKQDSSHLNLMGRGTVGFDGRYQFSGQVGSGPELPNIMKPLLAQLGRANAQGQIDWQAQGRLF
ncbi:hypothetical protein C9426_22255 [Serratia sp. S1B]|nr:hypothetical protein C9426_22255 [Serratia sp. S1B]